MPRTALEQVLWNGFRVHPKNKPLGRPGAYLFTCLPTGRQYVGIALDVARRCNDHGRSAEKPGRPQKNRFVSGLRKYGKSAFLLQPLVYSISSISSWRNENSNWLKQYEADLIVELDTIIFGFNVLENWNGGSGGPEFVKRSLEGRSAQQRSETFTKLNADPEFRAKVEKALSDPALLERRNASIKAAYAKPGGKDKIRRSRKDPAYLENQSRKGKARFANEEAHQKARDAQAKVADKHSASLKAAWATRPRFWITNGTNSSQHFSDLPIPQGWRRGRSGLFGRAAARYVSLTIGA